MMPAHRLAGDAERACDLRRRQAVDLEHRDDESLPRRERRQSRDETIANLAPLRQLERIRRARWKFTTVRLRGAQRARFASIDPRVDQQAKEPRRKGTAVIEALDSVQRAHERLLHQILRILHVPKEAPRDRRRVPNVTAHERVVRRHIAMLDPIDQLTVVQVGHVMRRDGSH